ncbi:MAG TPA: glucosamine-6-phosphate deaminase [Hanamia sp.]|nr:glucosamine-6-phosphate deaminase [Hanamia sp.]
MELLVFETYQKMSEKAADAVIKLIRQKRNAVVSPASGNSPEGLYRNFVERVNQENIKVSELFFVGLDEWMGMNGSDEGSCRYYLNEQLFFPLKINEEKIAFFDGRAENSEAECQRIDKAISEHNGIDLAIVGLGMNGHVGMNEPGTSPALLAHISQIDPVTAAVGQKYFREKTNLSSGLTLGIANLLEAKNIMLVVSGSKKAEILKKVLEEKISIEIPASLLRNHSNFSVYADAEAASLLKK